MRGFVLLALFALVPMAGAAELSFQAQDLGEIYPFHRAPASITITNPGAAPVRILRAVAAEPDDRVLDFPAVVPAGGSATAHVEVFPTNESGGRLHQFRFTTDEAKRPERMAAVHFFALSVLTDARPNLEFGVVDAGKAVGKPIAFKSDEVADFRLTRVIAAPAFVVAKIGADGQSLDVTLKSDAPWGVDWGFVKLATNTPRQPEVWVRVAADVHGDVVPAENPINLNIVRVGQHGTFLSQLDGRNGKPVRVGQVRLEGAKGSVAAAPCAKPRPDCALLKIDLADDQPPGRVAGKIYVELPDYHRTLPIDLWALLLPKDVQVGSLDKALKDAQSGKPPAAPLDLASSLQKTTRDTQPVEMPKPPGKGPLLTWAVEHEAGVYGYLIYRADAETGPFLRVNADIVHVLPHDPAVGSVYHWRDDSAVAGKTYWYQIGLIHQDGHKQQLSGPQKVVAK